MRNGYELHVHLGQLADEFCNQNPDTDHSVTMGESRITSGEHLLGISIAQKRFELVNTLFSSVDLSDGKVARVEYNPQVRYLSRHDAELAVGELEGRLSRVGFDLTRRKVGEGSVATIARQHNVLVKASLKVVIELDSIEAYVLKLNERLYLIDVGVEMIDS